MRAITLGDNSWGWLIHISYWGWQSMRAILLQFRLWSLRLYIHSIMESIRQLQILSSLVSFHIYASYVIYYCSICIKKYFLGLLRKVHHVMSFLIGDTHINTNQVCRPAPISFLDLRQLGFRQYNLMLLFFKAVYRISLSNCEDTENSF